MPTATPTDNESSDNPMANSMNATMKYTMPLFSVVMCFTFPSGIGLYWVASAVVRMVQQLAVNKYLSKISLEELIEENQKKAAKKREKKVLMQRSSIRNGYR